MSEYWDHVNEIRREMAERRPQVERERLEESLAIMNVPRKHWGVTLDKVPEHVPHRAKVLEWQRRYLEDRSAGVMPTGLFLHGPPGTGKTAIAVGILKWALKHHAPGFFLDAAMIADVARDNPPVHPQAPEGMWDYAQRAELLVLDDILRHLSDNSYGQLVVTHVGELLRRRLALGGTTVVTGNFPPAQLEERYPSIANLLVESCYDVSVEGLDYRARIAKKRGPL